MSQEVKVEEEVYRLNDSQDKLLNLLFDIQSRYPESNWKFYFCYESSAFQISGITTDELQTIIREYESAEIDGIVMHFSQNANSPTTD